MSEENYIHILRAPDVVGTLFIPNLYLTVSVTRKPSRWFLFWVRVFFGAQWRPT